MRLKLRLSIVLAVVVGLLIPAAVGSFVTLNRQEKSLAARLSSDHARLTEVLALGVESALWDVNPESARPLLESLLADDRVWVDSRVKRCERYLAVEISDRAARPDCGGRTPHYDAVDVFRSLLVNGRTSGVDDGVPRDDGRHPAEFPFLAAPGQPN